MHPRAARQALRFFSTCVDSIRTIRSSSTIPIAWRLDKEDHAADVWRYGRQLASLDEADAE